MTHKKKYVLEHEIILDVAFHHLDPMEVVWHGNYFRFFERARCAMLQLINYDYPQMRESGFAWPVVECKCRFSRPMSYGMQVKVLAGIAEFENRLVIEYLARNYATGAKLCSGYTIQAAVDMRTGSLCFVAPDILTKRLASRSMGNKHL